MLINTLMFSCCWAGLTLGQELCSFLYCPTSEWATTVREMLWGRAARTADPNWSKRYSIWCHVQMVSCWTIKLCEVGWQGVGLLPGDCLGISQWVMNNCICITCSVYSFVIIIIFFLPSYSVLINCLYLSPGVLLFFCDSLPHPTVGCWVKGCVVFSCLLF